MRQYSIAKKSIEGYLHQPYSSFLNRHSADLGKTILSEVGIIVSSALKPFFKFNCSDHCYCKSNYINSFY